MPKLPRDDPRARAPVLWLLTSAVVLAIAAPGAGAAAERPTTLPPEGKPAVHKIAVEVRGPLVMVQVTRVLYPADDARAPGEVVLDVALPEGAALIDLEISDNGRWHPAEPIAAEHGRDLYVEAMRQRGLVAVAEPFDDSAVYRIRAALAETRMKTDARLFAPVTLRYRFSALSDYAGGRRRLRFPAAPETTPVPADVTVTLAGATDVEIAGARTALGGAAASGHATGRASTRSGWEISWAPRGETGRAGGPGETPTLDAAAVAAPLGATESAVAFAVQARAAR